MPREKILVIGSCLACPHEVGFKCRLMMKRDIDDLETIPEFCPLEDA